MAVITVSAITGFIIKVLTAFRAMEVLKAFFAPFAMIFSAITMLWVKLWVPVSLWIGERIAEMFYPRAADWAPFLETYIARLTGREITIEEITREGFGMGSKAAMRALGETFLTPMLNLIMPDPRDLKEKPLEGAETFLGVNLQFQLGAWLLHFIGDAVSLGRFKSLKDLPNAIAWSYGIGWLSWMVMGPVFRAGITQAMEKHFARIYVPELYTSTQAIDAARHGEISYEDYLNEMMDRGISPRKAEVLYQIAQKDYSDADIRTLIQLDWMTEDEAQVELVRRGYEPGRSRVLARLLADDRKFKIIDKITDQAGDLYRDEVLSEGSYREYLAKAGYTREEQDLQVNLQQIQKGKRRWLTPAQVVSAWKQKVLGRVECKDYLLRLGLTPEDAEIYMTLKES